MKSIKVEFSYTASSTPTKLGTPTILSAKNVTATSATLSWDAVANASSYELNVLDDQAVYVKEAQSVSGTSYDLTGLTASTTYTWSVKAIGNGSNYTDGDESDDVEFTTLAQGGGEPSGDGTTVTFDNLGYESWGKSASFSGSTYDELSQTKNNVVFDYTRGSGSTYANTTSIRFYKDNQLKFTAPDGYKITSIVWTGSTFKDDVTTDVGTCTSTTSALSWSGNASSVTFTRPSDASGYVTLSSVSVTIVEDGGDTPSKTITGLAISGTPTKTTYNVGDEFDPAGLTVTATYSDETQEVISTGFNWEIDYGTGNEALVAGATSVDVMVYAGEVMSEIFTVNGLTVIVPVTLTSISVSGTPTKTEYYVGDAFETAGLVVTGTYSDGTETPITEGIEWTIDPETLAEGTTSVDVIAGIGEVVSEVFTVEGLTVTENPYKTATVSSFSAISGDINTDISYEAFQGDASTAPAVNSNNLRLYQNGGYVTVKALTGLKIASVKITTSATYASTIVGYCLDDDDAPTTGETVERSSDYTISNLNNNSVSIYCLGTDKNTRLEIAAIEVVYSGTTVVELKNIILSGTYPTEFNKGDEFYHEGMTVTANYTDGSDADVTSEATFSGYNMNTLGEQTVTVSYTEDEITKTAEYTITVNKAPFVPTPVAEGYETVDFTVIEPYASLTGTQSANVEDYEGTSFAMAFAKPESSTTPTKYYNSGTSVRAYTGNTITITGAENIVGVDIAWVSNYVDDAVSIIGLGTTTAVVTFSKTCRFTKVTVSYRGSNSTLVATDGENYYATFSSEKNVVFANATAYTVSVADDKLTLTEVARNKVPASNAVLIKSATTNVDYYYVDGDKDFKVNMLAPCPETAIFKAEADGNYYYKLAYGDNTNKTKLGFWWGAEDGSGNFKVKAGGAVLVVPQSAGSNLRGFRFEGEGTTTAIESINNVEVAGEIFNLQGQRMSRIQKGVNIINGKKVLR